MSAFLTEPIEVRINGLLILIAVVVVVLGVVCSDQLLGTKVIETAISKLSPRKKEKPVEPVKLPLTKDDSPAPQAVVATITSAQSAEASENTTSTITSSAEAQTNTAAAENTPKESSAQSPKAPAATQQASKDERASQERATFITHGAAALYREKKYGEALFETAKALEVNEHCAYAYHVRACIYKDKDLIKSAAIDFKHAVWADPNKFAWDLDGISEMYIRLGKPKEAVAVITDFIASHPDNFWGYNARSMAYRELGEWDKAIADANATISKSPKQFESLTVLVDSYSKEKKYPEALKAADTLIRYYPKIDWLYARRAELCEKTGDITKAKEDRARAERLRPGH